jgi:hypothetical protein
MANIMDALINFISAPTGSTLGFVGIAITYFATVVFYFSKKGRRGLHVAYIIAGIFFCYLAYLCQQRGTVKVVDAGIVLAYLGIGAGLVCAASVAPSHAKCTKILAWFVMIIGICFEVFGLILVHHAGLL